MKQTGLLLLQHENISNANRRATSQKMNYDKTFGIHTMHKDVKMTNVKM